MGQRLSTGRMSARDDDMPTDMRCGQERCGGEWPPLGLCWPASLSSWRLTRGQIDLSPATVPLKPYCGVGVQLQLVDLRGQAPWCSGGQPASVASAAGPGYMGLVPTQQPSPKLISTLAKATWQSCFVNRLFTPQTPNLLCFCSCSQAEGRASSCFRGMSCYREGCYASCQKF